MKKLILLLIILACTSCTICAKQHHPVYRMTNHQLKCAQRGQTLYIRKHGKIIRNHSKVNYLPFAPKSKRK